MPYKCKQKIICIGCNKEHLTWRPDRTRFCSIKCGRSFQPQLKQTKESKKKIQDTNIKTYEKIKYKWQGENNHFFGKKHSQETKDKIGVANKGNIAHWKGGITAENKLERERFRRDIQGMVLKRDNYTCQLCGSGVDLQVDHIQSWVEYVELRFSMDNCRTLCAKCHYKLTFGREMPAHIIGKWGHGLKLIMKGGY